MKKLAFLLALIALTSARAAIYDSESISINFIGATGSAPGMSIDADKTAGVFEVPGSKWNQIINQSGVAISETGIVLKELKKDGTLAESGVTVNVTASGCGSANGYSSPVSGNGQMFYGFLSDGATSGGYSADIKINNIPYSEYTVYVYMGGDVEREEGNWWDSQFLPIYVNDVQKPSQGYGSFWGGVSKTHESGSALTLSEDDNYQKITGLSSSTLKIKSSVRGNQGDRGCVAAIQIVNTGASPEPEPEDPGYDEEVLATYYGFDTLTSGKYTANLNGNSVFGGKVTISSGAIKFTGGTAWTGADAGISVLVKYSDFAQPSANAALVTIKNTQAAASNQSGVGVYSKSSDSKVHGIWNGGVWGNETAQTSKPIGEDGYLVFVYKGGTSGCGTFLYDGTGELVYGASGLKSSNSQSIGDVLTIGALGDNTLIATNMVIQGARIFKGALSADEIVAAVADYESGGPSVSGAACVYDWTFTNTVQSTGSTTIRAATGSQKTTSLTGDNNAKYTNLTNGLYTALLSFVRPYVNVQASGGKSYAYYGTVSPQQSAIVFALGQVGGSLFVATGTDDNEIVLARTTSSSVSVADSTLETVTDVDKPVTKPHLYVLHLSSDMLTAKLTIDGEEACTHTFSSAPSISTGIQLCGMFKGKPSNWKRDESETTTAINCFRIFDHDLSDAECAALVAEFKPLWPEEVLEPEITKDPTTHTWIVDTTKAAYDFTDADISDLAGTAWKVTLKSQSDYRATIDFDERTGSQPSHYVIESGTHNLRWIGNSKSINFNKTGTGEDPSVLVMDGATLNFTAKDITGWQGAANVKTGNVIRVNGGGMLKLLQNGTDTHYYQGRYWLDPGATLNADSYAADKFCLNGGAFEGSEQLYMPDSSKGSDAATVSAVNGIKLANDVTAGLGVCVGKNSTLEIDAPITGTQPLQKWGTGTLALDGVLTGYTGALTVNAGTLELAQSTLGGSLTMAAGTALDLHYDGVPTHGTVVLTAASLVLDDNVNITVDGVIYVLAKTATTLTIEHAVAKVGDKSYGTIVAAAKAAGDGGVMTLLKPYVELEDEIDAAAITLTQIGETASYTNNYKWAEGSNLIVTEIMPKPSDKPDEIVGQAGYDKNGLESGWVELLNTTNAWVDLKDYKFIRVNRSKANSKGDYGNFPSAMIAPGERYVFWTSERYANSASMADSAFETPVDEGKPHFFPEYNMMVWPDKVNPKKFAFVRFSYNPEGGTEQIIDTVVIPSDIPEGYSIVVKPIAEDEATVRYLCASPTEGTENPPVAALEKLGPNVGPLYEIKGGKKHDSASEFGAVPPAKTTEAYTIPFSLNPTMSPTEFAKFRDMDAITGIKLVYRFGVEGAPRTNEVALTHTTDDKDQGDQYTAEIPAEDLAALNPGTLIQWKFLVTDAAGNEWTSPSFHNPDDGYEWYGTITEPGDLNSANLPTWHMFLDSDSLKQMDTDADKQTLPYNARAAIYDASTSNYYDYVRIDLRGNTSKNFTKKSHGFRFAKAHPLTMHDFVSGKDIEEIRKTSLIGEPADPSYMRQLVSFWLLNKVGSPAPFDFPVRVNRNGEFYQMAFNSERFTDELIEDVYGLDKYGFSYKNVGTLKSNSGTTAGSIEKKTPDDGNESDITVLQNELRAKIKAAQDVGGTTTAQLYGTDTTGLDNPALTKFVVQKFNLPAWLNYLAITKITQEMDDVWANISMYYDNAEMKEGARGTGTWMPLAYDMNVCFGQHYCEGGVGKTGPIGNMDRFKGHPFYGGNRVRCYSNDACTSTLNDGNDGFEAVWQSAKFRRLYLRRLRTLMDQELKAPGTPETEIPLMVKMRELETIMHDDAATDRAKYPDDGSFSAIDVWGSSNFPATMALGIDDLWTNYIQPRQTHLYVTHSITNVSDSWQVGYGVKCNAGIPAAQSPIAELKGGFTAEFDEASGMVRINNANDEVIDLSDWTLEGPMAMALPPGTVVDANDSVFVVADRRAYVAAIDADITDQVIVGNATLGADPTAPIVLKAADGTDVIAPDTKSEQEKYLRLWGFCGVPQVGDDAEGEFMVFTNLNQTAELDATGADIQFEKVGESEGRCHFALPEGTIIPPGGWVRFDRNDIPWIKITNGNLDIVFKASNGAVIYSVSGLSQESLGVKGTGYFAVYDFGKKEWTKMLIADAPLKPVPPAEDIVLTGDYPDGTNIVLTADTTVIVSNATFGAKLAFSTNFVATVVLPADTASAAKAITSDGKLVFAGEGKLTLTGEKELVAATGDLVVEGGELELNATIAKDKASVVPMTGNFVQTGGKVTLNMTGDKKGYGLRWSDQKGFTATISGGEFVANVASGEGSAAFKANKGSNDFTLGGGKLSGSMAAVDGRIVDVAGNVKINGDAVVAVTGDETAAHARVFKTEKKVTIGGTATVDVKAPGVESEAFSADNQITIEGGVVRVDSADDCFSAQTNIVVSGGIVYGHSVSNDVFDSNGQMTISGGTVIAYTLAEGHEAFDTEPATADEQSHTFTISGGTIVGLGGKNAAWPTTCVFEQNTFTRTDLDPAAYSGQYLVVDGEVEKFYAKLPEIGDSFIVLATVKGLTGDPTVSATCPVETPIAEDVPAWRKLKHNQQSLRFAEIYGNTAEGSEEAGTLGDVGEYVVLTNMSDSLEIDLTGVKVNLWKLGDWQKYQKEAKSKYASKCSFTIASGTLAPGASVTLKQADYASVGWTKITNNELYISLTDSTEVLVQSGETASSLYPECDGNGASLVAKTFGKTIKMSVDDWRPSVQWFSFVLGEDGATITGVGPAVVGEAALTVPTSIGMSNVVAIADGAFADCANLRYLVFQGAPLDCTSAAFPAGVIGSYDAAKAGWTEAIVDGKWNGLVMLTGAEETISVNIAAGYPLSGEDLHGLFGVAGDQWLNVTDTWSIETTTTIDAGAVTAVVSGVSVARTNVVVKVAAANTYTYNATDQEQFFKGYLDDGGNHARITVENVPYSKYDVVVYGTSDQGSRALSPVTVNGLAYTWADETAVGSSVWGATRARQPKLGQNTLWIPNQTAVTLKIVGGANANDARGGIAAVQIVNRGEIDEEPGKDFIGTMSESAALETVAWENGPFEPGRKNTAAIMLAGEDELTLTLSDPLVTLKSLAITGENALWLAADVYPRNIAALDLAGIAGLVTYGWPVYALESSSANVAYAGGAGAPESPVALNPKGGKLWLRGGTYYIANKSWSGTSTTVDVDDSVLDFGEGIFGVGTAVYTIGGASEVTAASFVLSQGEKNRTAVVTLKDEAVLNVTGNTIIDKNTSSIMLGHWNGKSTLTITNNAVFNAPHAEVLVGKTGNSQTINIAGGVFSAYGIKASGNASGSNRINLYGGELKLGAGGISSYSSSCTIATSVTADAQITATADMTIDQPITVAEGVTLMLGSENGATFTVSSDTFSDASAGKVEVVKGNVKLAGEGVLGAQTLKVDEGATVSIALADFGEITAEGVKPFEVEAGDVETFLRVVISDGAQHPYVKFDVDPASPAFGKLVYTAPKCELTGLHIAEICGKPTGKDPNGRVSGWVELVNYGPEAVNLKDYKLYRLNYGKKDKSADAKKMLDRVVQPNGRTLVYMSEDYPTAEDYGGDGVTVKNYGLVDGVVTEDAPDSIMVIPTKINQKKYPRVTLYDASDKVIDQVVVPCEIDDDGSVLVGITTNKTERFVTFTPSPLAEKDFATAIAIGPEVNGLYGKKDYVNDLQSLNQHAGFAPADTDFTVRMPVNPVCESALAADQIASVRLVYRVFDPAGSQVKSVPMKKSKATTEEESRWGKKSGVWEGAIPAGDMLAGKLVQYAAMITDGSGVEWRAPRFVYPELGYEWYGVVVDPGEAVRTDGLQTFLLFIDNANKAQMDKDADKQTLQYCARTAVYDTQTHTYYDNVRIDLRGNTSAGFTKKSHGLRFNKVAPLVCADPTTGEELEVRKTSFIAEFADPTYMRQMLSFWMLREAGCTVPFDYPARLYLNGEYYQLAFHSVRFSDDMVENVYGLNKYVYSYKNIGTFGGSTSAGGIEKKTPDDDNESDLTLLNAYCKRFNAAKNGASLTEAQKAVLDHTVVTNFDLASWINYIAATRISSECDDVWANLSGYIDQYDAFYNAKGDNMMYPLAYDMNLSFGQWYYGDVGGTRSGLKADKDWYKSHPYYGGFVVRAHSSESGGTVGNANYAFETILQNPRNRELLVRRIRTLMDKFLGAPGTPREETLLGRRMQYYADLMSEDAAIDRAKWPIDSTANNINVWGISNFPSFEAGLEDLWTNYVVPRREHLYVTHSITNETKALGYGTDLNAGIPLAQACASDLKGALDVFNLDGEQLFTDTEVLVLTNKSNAAIDLSGWQLKYSVACTLPGGTVIPANGCVYVPASRLDFIDKLVAAGEVADQIVLPSATFKVTGAIALVADDGTEVVKRAPDTNESEYLRLHSFCGNTADAEGTGDVGEWFVLTNISNEVELDLAGVTVCFLKEGDPESVDHCHVTFAKGKIAPGAAQRFDQADYADKGWVKIQNNKLGINLCDFYGSVAQTLAVAQKDYPEAYGKGGWLVADSTAKVVGKKQWHVETGVVPVQPGEAQEMKAKTEEEAYEEIAKYEVKLTDDDKAAGVDPDSLMMEPVAVSNETTGVVTYYARVAVNPLVVEEPAVGEGVGTEGEIKPIEVTPDEEGNVEVAVGINNATKGLWYGYETSESLGTAQAFVNDLPSFRRADGSAIKVTGSKRSGNAAFFRVKVLPAKPTE